MRKALFITLLLAVLVISLGCQRGIDTTKGPSKVEGGQKATATQPSGAAPDSISQDIADASSATDEINVSEMDQIDEDLNLDI